MAVALAFTPVRDADFDQLLDSALVGPLAEEILFRGFLCLQLVQRAGWRISPAIAVSSALFAFAHLPFVDVWVLGLPRPEAFLWFRDLSQPGTLSLFGPFAMYSVETVGINGASYALGGALFAWVAWRWQSLWPAVALHACMNFWWVLSQTSSRLEFAVTPMTVGHALAIAIAIIVTLRLTRSGDIERAASDSTRAAAWDRLARPDSL
jgi:membrane protease YdiL (CAAX protease family)